MYKETPSFFEKLMNLNELLVPIEKLRTQDFGEFSRVIDQEVDSLIALAKGNKEKGISVKDQDFPIECICFDNTGSTLPPLLIMGGMGPLAGVQAAQMAIQKFGDSRTIVLYQLTATPDRTAAIKEGADSEMYAGTIATLQDGMDILRSMVEGEADVVTTCNTAHHFLAQIDYPEGIRPASLIRSTCESLIEDMRDGDVQVFALYTSGTRGAEVYSAEMSQNQISFVEPDMDTQDELMNAIYKGVKAFDSDIAFEEGEKVFRKIPEGTTHILAGCTEIPEVIDLVIERTTDSDLRDKLRGLRVVDPTSEAFDSVLRISSVQDDARSKIGIN